MIALLQHAFIYVRIKGERERGREEERGGGGEASDDVYFHLVVDCRMRFPFRGIVPFVTEQLKISSSSSKNTQIAQVIHNNSSQGHSASIGLNKSRNVARCRPLVQFARGNIRTPPPSPHAPLQTVQKTLESETNVVRSDYTTPCRSPSS